jgi:hypothetical protein
VFHAIELGSREAPPLVWLHGFPDHPPTAVPFLDQLRKSRCVIAPWLRATRRHRSPDNSISRIWSPTFWG